MTVIRMRRKQNIYFISSWVVILIGLVVFWYFMNHEVPEKNKEYIIALVGGFAGITLLAGYKVVGKDQAMDEIEELKSELQEWKHRHDACEQKHSQLEKEVSELRKIIVSKMKQHEKINL